MREEWSFDKTALKIGKHRTLKPERVGLVIATQEDQDDPADYIEGVRTEGKLVIDVPFHTGLIRPGAEGLLTVEWEGDTSRFPVVFTELTDSFPLVPNKVKRHFWHFFGVGRPHHDGIELFPRSIMVQTLKVFTVTDFVGHWPGAVAAVVVARDQKEAHCLLMKELEKHGLAERNKFMGFTLKEMDPATPRAVVLCDGHS